MQIQIIKCNDMYACAQLYEKTGECTVISTSTACTGGSCQFSPGPLAIGLVVINIWANGKASKLGSVQ